MTMLGISMALVINSFNEETGVVQESAGNTRSFAGVEVAAPQSPLTTTE